MKTVILFGSPRKDGNTRQLVNIFTDVIKERRQDVRLLYLNDLNIRPCQGCAACVEQGVCRIPDDMRDIRKYIVESDIIVYATPIYWYGPSGQLKLAMDRCVAFLDKEYNSRIKGKQAVTLMTCASDEADTCSPALDMFRKTFEGLGIEYSGGIEAIGCTDRGQVAAEKLAATRRLAEALLTSKAL